VARNSAKALWGERRREESAARLWHSRTAAPSGMDGKACRNSASRQTHRRRAEAVFASSSVRRLFDRREKIVVYSIDAAAAG